MPAFYNKEIGYSPLESIDQKKLHHLIVINKKIIDNYYIPQKDDIILVAGTGLGWEAYYLFQEFNLKTIGVDLNLNKTDLIDSNPKLLYEKQDLTNLAFRKNLFSFIYSYHVLEHVIDHMAVLKEIYRVLKPGGVLFIGFPNKNRLISYIGTSQKTSGLDKIKWNINDYIYRLQGKFENKHGAHAGFTEKEFIKDASSVFDKVYSVRNRYMLIKYPNLGTLMTVIIKTKLEEYIFPSNYYICIKRNRGDE